MSTPNTFAGLTQSPGEKVIVAIAETLRDNAAFADFFPSVQSISVAPDPLLQIDQPIPFLAIAPLTDATEFHLSGETEQTLLARLFFVYDERRDTIGNFDPTVRSLINDAVTILFNNPTLKVAAFGNISLAHRLARIGLKDFGSVEAEGGVRRIQALDVEYEYKIVATTGELP